MNIQNTSDLRTFLIQRMVALAEGKESVSQTNSVARIAAQITQTLSLEISAASLMAKHQKNKPESLKLG